MFADYQNAFAKCKLDTAYLNPDIYGKTLFKKKKKKNSENMCYRHIYLHQMIKTDKASI